MNRDTETLDNNVARFCSALQHRSVAYFEDAPCYPIEKLVKLHGMRRNMLEEKEEAKQLELAKEYQEFMDTLCKLPDAPSRIYLCRLQENIWKIRTSVITMIRTSGHICMSSFCLRM